MISERLNSDGSTPEDFILSLAEDYADRIRAGESVAVEDYVASYPEVAAQIEQYFPMISLMGDLVSAHDEARDCLSDVMSVGDSAVGGTAGMGSHFGRYEVLRLLGRGQMGRVYLARDTQLDRLVALKVPRFDRTDARVIDRFYREARAMATVHHANLCPLYDVGEIDGQCYLTMAYFEGATLAERIKTGPPLSAAEAVDLIRKLATGLDVAHDAGIVHRDLKPSNVMFDANDEPVIMDFGLARRHRDGEEEITHEGVAVGTPVYMSPEQIEGRSDQIGPQTDVYSLGVMLFELLCGCRPFQGPVMKVLGLIVSTDPPAPRSLKPELDPQLEEICLNAMAKPLNDRFRSAAAFAKALDDYQAGRPATLPAQETTAKGTSQNHVTGRQRETSVPSAIRRLVILGLSLAAMMSIVVVGIRSSNDKPEITESVTTSGQQVTPIRNSDAPHPDNLRSHTAVNGHGGVLRDSGQRLGQSSSSVVQLGDLDGDGDLDAFVGCTANEADRIWLNDGGGIFHDSGQRLGNSMTVGLSLGDLDGDGDLDAVTTSLKSAATIWRNTGTGKFDGNQQLMIAGHIAIGDFNGDGDGDLFVSRSGANVILWNDGSGQFVDSGQKLGDFVSCFAACGDIDNDGDVDAYVCNNLDEPDILYLNDGTGQLVPSAQDFSRSQSSMARIVDWDGDSMLDVLIGVCDGPMELWLHKPNGEFAHSPMHKRLKPFEQPTGNCITIGDFDGDSDNDLFAVVTTERSGPASFVRNETTTLPAMTMNAVGLMRGVWADAGDLDGDGTCDVFVATGPKMPEQVWLNRSVLNLDEMPMFVQSDHPFGAIDPRWAVAVADFDGDADLDVFAPGYRHPGGIWLLEQTGAFRYTGQTLALQSASWVSGGDLDGDNDIDIFASSHGGPDMVWLNDGSGVFEESEQEFAPAWSRINTLVDVDLDGDLDVVVAVWDDEDQLWLNDGNGQFTPGGKLTGNSSYGVAAGDIDNDGDPDLVFTPPATTGLLEYLVDAEPVRLWINDGKGRFERSPQEIAVPFAHGVTLADLNGDANLDMVVGGNKKEASPTQVFFGDGAGGFTASPETLPAMSTFAIAHGDLDNDGDIDLVTGNLEEPNEILLNDGTGHFKHQQWYSRHHSSPHLVDLEGDGDLDIVDSSGGIWLNQTMETALNDR